MSEQSRLAVRTATALLTTGLTLLSVAAAPAGARTGRDGATVTALADKGGSGQGATSFGQGLSAASGAGASALAAAPQITRSEVLARAESWVGLGLSYSWTTTHQGYRQDCSGYVSMAWRLSTPGLDTTSFIPSGTASWIGKEQLQPGDALLNDAAGAYGHIALFERWADAAHTSYVAYEFTGSGVHHRTIPYPYFPGYGTYRPARNNSVLDTPTPPAARQRLDFNGDGKADVAGKLADGSLLLWTGNGDGSLNTASGYAMWPDNGFGNVSDLIAADFNNDGKTDIAGKLADGSLLLWTGNGNGTLNTASGYSMWPGTGFSSVHNLIAADFNGDGKADVAGKLADGSLLLWTGNGDGSLNTASGYAMWPDNGFGNVSDLIAADFNNDGKTDIAGKLADGSLLLWTGNGNGTLNTASGYSMWPGTGFSSVHNLIAADFNGDGKADVAGKLADGSLLLWTGNGDGSLNTASGYAMWPDNGFGNVSPLIS
ncbi:FG-GAP-like repeat-containing protein [Kitasatospora sp. NPDC004289]